MTDFLITMMTLYPWFTWLLVVFFALTVAFWLLLGIVGIKSVLDWSEMKREDRRILADILARAHSDPPEYQHPDGDERFEVTRIWRPESGEDWIPDDDGPDWDGPPDDWSPAAEWGEKPWRSLGTMTEVLARAREIGMLNDDDQLPDGPPVSRVPKWWCEVCGGGPIMGGSPPRCIGCRAPGPSRCTNRDCFMYGTEHWGSACDVAPTMPAACYTEGPAMPPQPVREYLHPQIMEDLKAAKFSEHETNEGAVESMFTRAQAREVQAMITDGVIPGGQEK